MTVVAAAAGAAAWTLPAQAALAATAAVGAWQAKWRTAWASGGAPTLPSGRRPPVRLSGSRRRPRRRRRKQTRRRSGGGAAHRCRCRPPSASPLCRLRRPRAAADGAPGACACAGGGAGWGRVWRRTEPGWALQPPQRSSRQGAGGLCASWGRAGPDREEEPDGVPIVRSGVTSGLRVRREARGVHSSLPTVIKLSCGYAGAAGAARDRRCGGAALEGGGGSRTRPGDAARIPPTDSGYPSQPGPGNVAQVQAMHRPDGRRKNPLRP